MNKTIMLLLFIGICIPGILPAQDVPVTQSPKTEYPVLEKKLKKSDADKDDPKKNINPKFWLSRAELMLDIYDVNRKYVEGQQKITITFTMGKENEIRTEEKDGELYEIYVYDRVNVIFKNDQYHNYVETSKIFENPLDEANMSLDKAQELDTDGKLSKKLKEANEKLSELYMHKGSRAYFFEKDELGAYNNFVASLNVNAKPVMENKIDTALMFNAGFIASRLGKYDESIKFFNQALEYNYPEPRSYVYLYQAYVQKGDTLKGLEYLQNGFTKNPESQEIVVELINYYLLAGKSGEALEYIKIAQEKDPGNVSLIFAEATLYDKNGEFEKAIEIYKKTTALQPDFFNGYYNLGVLYYNRGQQLYKDADAASLSEFKNLQDKGDEQFKLVIEPMESCMKILEEKTNISADDKETLSIVYETLKSVYYRLQKYDPAYAGKVQEMKDKLGQ
ncbi:MAG: tetratricopeptide repeat protein [Bacteroidales bacterium]|nr:tetratricopeptide repeat protein [Bacteroidales bacterium]